MHGGGLLALHWAVLINGCPVSRGAHRSGKENCEFPASKPATLLVVLLKSYIQAFILRELDNNSLF